MKRDPVLHSLVLALVLGGCGKDECMSVQQFDTEIYCVLPSGLVLHEGDAGTNASMLGEGGTLELVATLDSGGCYGAAHDPERGKLWWITPGFNVATPSLHQLDLASGVEDWQRDLVYDGYVFNDTYASLLAHDGALYLGGSLQDPENLLEGRSLLERIDVSGQTVWTQIGHPGTGFDPESDGTPLEGLHTLLGTSTGISFLGTITGIDSSAITAATVDAQTGELLWSTNIDRDDYSSVNFMSGDGESLYVLTGVQGSSFEGETRHARSDMVSFTPLGEENWRIDQFVWSKFIHARYAQAVAGGDVVHLVLGGEGWEAPQRVHVTRRRSSDGALICASDLPDVVALGTLDALKAHAVGDQLVLEVSVEVNPDEYEYETTWLLLQRTE